MKNIQVCTTCGSPRVKRDVWVNANNPDNVKTFDDVICDDCGTECSIHEVEVPDNFDMESDFYKTDNDVKKWAVQNTIYVEANSYGHAVKEFWALLRKAGIGGVVGRDPLPNCLASEVEQVGK